VTHNTHTNNTHRWYSTDSLPSCRICVLNFCFPLQKKRLKIEIWELVSQISIFRLFWDRHANFCFQLLFPTLVCVCVCVARVCVFFLSQRFVTHVYTPTHTHTLTHTYTKNKQLIVSKTYLLHTGMC